MAVAKRRTKRKRKHCPNCDEEVAMSVVREGEDENDLSWLLCPSCESMFALTRKEFQKVKQLTSSAVEKDNAVTYETKQVYAVAELIYHPKLDDIGFVTDKVAPPLTDCSGAIVVSFMKCGQRTLIEGYAPA